MIRMSLGRLKEAHCHWRGAAVIAALAIVAVIPARSLLAQSADTTSRTHTVKKGDTLWDLARFYLNNPFLWPRIYQLNQGVVHDPHWIYPGQLLRVPGDATAVARSAPPQQPAGQEAARDSVLDTMAQAPVEESGPNVGSTVFAQSAHPELLDASTLGGVTSSAQRTAVRPGEFYAAPWVGPAGGPAARGAIIANAEIAGIAVASERSRLTLEDRVYITLPAGVVPAVGDHFVTFTMGPVLPSGGQVVIPTGILVVERVGNGEATTARIVQQFGWIDVGNGVMQPERFAMAPGVRPAPVQQGTEARVVYIPSRTVLPSTQYYVVLNASAAVGVKVGDQFTLYRPSERTERGVTLPEEPIALAQVVRVTDQGVTGLVTDMRHPAIKEGAPARLTARMP
ncbi:MAG TPA: LysM peptidoglycan-binding domain-containing protein [Gemmatimonadaceae bacterium]|nr:LysM peptidoglycan-binding domain-containing protein [Gemmatimonadaceae bacterium]